MKKSLPSIAFIACLASSQYANAAAGYVEGKVTGVGCHKPDNVCYVMLDKVVGPSACSSDSVRFLSNDAGGKQNLSLFMMAQSTNRTVGLYIPTNECFSQQPSYPTFHWSVVK